MEGRKDRGQMGVEGSRGLTGFQLQGGGRAGHPGAQGRGEGLKRHKLSDVGGELLAAVGAEGLHHRAGQVDGAAGDRVKPHGQVGVSAQALHL